MTEEAMKYKLAFEAAWRWRDSYYLREVLDDKKFETMMEDSNVGLEYKYDVITIRKILKETEDEH